MSSRPFRRRADSSTVNSASIKRLSGSHIGVHDCLILLALVTIVGVQFSLAIQSAFSVDLLCVLLLINGVLASVGVFLSFRNNATLFMVSFYFSLIFCSLAPLQQISAEWRNIYMEDDVSYLAGAIVVFFTAVGLCALHLRNRPVREAIRTPWDMGILRRINNLGTVELIRLLLVVYALVVPLILLYNTALFTSRVYFGFYAGSLFPRELSILVFAVLHPFIFIGAVTGFILSLRTHKTTLIIMFGIAVAMAFLIYNPLIQARFRLSAMIVFFILTYIGWKSSRRIFWFIVIGILISPLLNTFRGQFGGDEDVRNISNFFVHMDYDAFTMICYIIKYVYLSGVDYGLSALSAFLFFVPRAIWSGKSEHVAKLIFDFLTSNESIGTDNLSTPPVAEGFFAFGLLGAVFACFAFFFIVYRIERRALAAESLSPAVFVACISPMFLFILLRGPLIVGVSEYTGAIAALFMVLFILGAWKPAMVRTRQSSRKTRKQPPAERRVYQRGIHR